MYKITLSKEQAELLIKALDLFARIGTGQWEEILRHPTFEKRILQSKTGMPIGEARIYIDYAKKMITGFDSGVSEGITVADEPNRVAYDMLQVIRHKIWHDKGEQSWEPMKWSDSPMIEISEEE